MRSVMKSVVRLMIKPALSGATPVAVQRRWINAIGLTLLGPKDARYSEQRIAGVPVLRILAGTQAPQRVVLYLHGGAFVMGGFASHRKLAASIAQAAQAEVWLPDYRLAPEHPYPAALQDALAVYAHLLEQGHDARSISIAGDSAGGGLSLSLAVAIRDAGLPQPAALCLLSPWVDLGQSGSTIASHARRDPMLSLSWLKASSAHYRRTCAVDDPACSPLFARLDNLPPVLIQVGSEEILLDDAQRLHRALQEAGQSSELQCYDGLWHVFQLHSRILKEADQAINAIARFMRDRSGPL